MVRVSRRVDDSNSPHLSVQEWTSLRDRVSKDQLGEVLARVVDIALTGKDKDALAACNTVIGWYVGNVADESRRNTRSTINLLFTQAQLVDGEVVDAKGVDILDVTPTPCLEAQRMDEIDSELASLAGRAERSEAMQ